eukprot:TRINITY_DN25090_c0_g1_i2.p1 TRINITY_DN25090_c0_g1~~TRINITY_DN25090_c0_g1_i2.p1  ORF type:complete len:120 (+),score=21.45 TRINITY_DN25090_c0_g1_i2:87-446(+)
MKQKMVMKVPPNGQKGQSKALKTVVGVPGVISASVEGADKNLIVITGEDIDSVLLTKRLRKKVGFTELISVTPTDEKKKEEEKPKIESTVPQPVYAYQFMPPNYGYVIQDPNPDPCCIM